MATVLTGRFVELEILPFSMAECLSYRGVRLAIEPSVIPELPEDTAALMIEIDSYMKFGGFPEISKSRSISKGYMESLFDSIVLKDVAQRHSVRKTQELYNLADYLVSNCCNLLSYNDIANELMMSSVTTTKKFCDCLAEPYLFFYLPRFNNKLKLMKNAPMKIYVVDNGFISAKSFELSSNSGRQLENMVFVELLRRGNKPGEGLFYYRTRSDREVDFVIKKEHKVTSLIQVSYDLSNFKTREREIKALVEASKELGCKDMIILNRDKDDTVVHNGCSIRLVSVRKWFLGAQKKCEASDL